MSPSLSLPLSLTVVYSLAAHVALYIVIKEQPQPAPASEPSERMDEGVDWEWVDAALYPPTIRTREGDEVLPERALDEGREWDEPVLVRQQDLLYRRGAILEYDIEASTAFAWRSEPEPFAVPAPLDPMPIGHAVIAVAPGSGRALFVRRTLVRARKALADCYEPAVAADPDAAGDIHLELEIARDGHVLAADATGFDLDVASCVAAAVHTLGFPQLGLKDHLHASVPMTFRPYHSQRIRR